MPDVSAPSMIAEVLSVGDEMTGGARVDTNAAWISRRLEEMGIEVAYHTTVGDDLQRHVNVLRTAARRADILVSTGGLGPTQDDLSRHAIAEASQTELVFDADSFSHIESIFSSRGRSMAPSNRIQAMFPEGSKPIFNPQGTAPGIDFELSVQPHTAPIHGNQTSHGSQTSHSSSSPEASRLRGFALPGVPAEMKTMFAQSVAPELAALSGRRHIRSRVLKFFGTGESDMESRLGDLIQRGRTPRVGITVSSATISLRVTAMAESPAVADAQVEATVEEIMQKVGDLYFGEGEEFEQQDAVLATLAERGQTLTTVEFGAAAPLASWLAASGNGAVYRGGASCPDREHWKATIGLNDFPSAASQFRSLQRADWLLCVDAYPTLPKDPNAKLPFASVTTTIVGPSGQPTEITERIGGHPEILHPRIAKAALAEMRRQLQR